MFEMFSNLLKPRPALRKATPSILTISGTNDYTELPQGFFRVETASGRKSLGFNCPTFLCWQVGTTVVVGRERITLDKPSGGTAAGEASLCESRARHPSGFRRLWGVIDTDVYALWRTTARSGCGMPRLAQDVVAYR